MNKPLLIQCPLCKKLDVHTLNDVKQGITICYICSDKIVQEAIQE